MLRAVDFGESDLVVHLLTPASGRLTAIAKGARRSTRRFPGLLDLFNHLRVEVERPRRGSLARLEHARLIQRLHRAALGLAPLRARLLPARAARSPRARGRGAARPRAALRLRRRSRSPALERGAPDRRARALLELRALGGPRAAPRAAPLRALRARGRAGAAPVVFHVRRGRARSARAASVPATPACPSTSARCARSSAAPACPSAHIERLALPPRRPRRGAAPPRSLPALPRRRRAPQPRFLEPCRSATPASLPPGAVRRD